MARFNIYSTRCDIHALGIGEQRDQLQLSIQLDHDLRDKIWFAVDSKNSASEHSVAFDLSSGLPPGINLDGGGPDRTIELEIDLNGDPLAREKFSNLGLMGLNLDVASTLDSVRIILRPSRADNLWSSQAPFFSLIACWRLDAAAELGSEVLRSDPSGAASARMALQAGAKANLILCAGFAAVQPPDFSGRGFEGLANLRWRLDIHAFGLSTGWSLFDLPGFGNSSPFDLGPLARWFAELLRRNGEWPDLFDGLLDDIGLPDWVRKLSLDVNLPLGLGFREIDAELSRRQDNYAFSLRAETLLLRWRDAELPLEDTRLELDLFSDIDEPGISRYRLHATVFEARYPEPGESGSYGFQLPFDVLGIHAECWRFRLGLHASGSSDAPGSLCLEALLEVGGLQIASALASGSKPIYEAVLRVLVRNYTVMTAPMGADAPKLFAGLSGDPFSQYQKSIPAMSYALNLAEPDPEEVNKPLYELGLEFVHGEFRKDERLFLAWNQRGDQLIRALAHKVLAGEPAGAVPAEAPLTQFGLELAWFGEGELRDLQLRLDWRDSEALKLGGGTHEIPPSVPSAAQCVAWEKIQNQGLHLPMDSPGVQPGSPEKASSYQLPAIRLELAQPAAHSLLLRRDAELGDSVALLLLYPGATQAGHQLEPLVRARVGFSLQDSKSGGGHREVLETANEHNDEAFLSLSLGYAEQRDTALRVIGWQEGQPPSFLHSYEGGNLPLQALRPLQPADPPVHPTGCPRPAPPPVVPMPLPYQAFAIPDLLGGSAWRLSLRFAAREALIKLFQSDAGSGVDFSIQRLCFGGDDHKLRIETQLTVRFGLGKQPFVASGEVAFVFDPGSLSLSLEDGAQLSFALPRAAHAPAWADRVPLPEIADDQEYAYATSLDLLGLEATALTAVEVDGGGDLRRIDCLMLSMDGGRFALTLQSDVLMFLRYTGLGADALNFLVEEFTVGPGGLDLQARLISSSLSVKGLKRPFALEQARLSMVDSRLDSLSIAASGNLPELLDEAPVNLAVTFVQHQPGGDIELDELVCELGDGESPILSRGTRFQFEISKLDLRYLSPEAQGNPPAGQREDSHFFFEISGSAQFTPDEGEFAGGLLEDLKSARVEFVRAPLSDEFTDHLTFSVELNEAKSFNVFNLFRMQIRSIGFHPNFEKFGHAAPALIIGGQCEFADIGDVVSADIDFHAMYLGLPKPGEVVPQVHFDGLRVEISSPEGFRIAGRVDRYDDPLLKGFAGEGTVYIPGFPELSAAFAFVRMRGEQHHPWVRGWFVAVEASKFSYPLPSIPVYLRQVGVGFGYRYTLPMLREFEGHTTLSGLIQAMLNEIKRHQTLARIDSWQPDPGKPGDPARWSIALEGVFTLGSSHPSAPFNYRASEEKKIKTLVAQILAAMRSDMTLVAATKVWFPVSVDDFFNDLENMRQRPLASGFLLYAPAQRRFLAHAAKGKNPYFGSGKDRPLPEQIIQILNGVHFEATLLIEPSLLHMELGWPDRLMFSLQSGPLRLECRGGMLYRLENDALIQGIFFSARGALSLSAGVNLGVVGMRLSAHVDIYFATRLLSALYLTRPLQSKLYAQAGLDLSVRFSVEAWMELDAGLFKIDISISFSLYLQIVVALEVGWAGGAQIGFRGRATVVVSVFGRNLSAQVAVAYNPAGVESARAALLPYMSSLLAPGQVPQVPSAGSDPRRVGVADDAGFGAAPGLTAAGVAADSGVIIDAEPLSVELPGVAPETEEVVSSDAEILQEQIEFVTSYVEGISHRPGQRLWLLWIMPAPESRLFYPVNSTADETNGWIDYALLHLPAGRDYQVLSFDPNYEHDENRRNPWAEPENDALTLRMRPRSGMQMVNESQELRSLSLRQLIAGCYRPADPSDYRDNSTPQRPFPQYLDDNAVPPALILPAQNLPGTRLSDDRVNDVNDPARGPSRELDPNSPYDEALAGSLQRGISGDLARFNAYAQGNQSFLLQTFYDDLVVLAEAMADPAHAHQSLPTDRPNILDTGMLVAIYADELPDWAKRRDVEGMPQLEFIASAQAVVQGQQYPLRPVMDFRLANFAENPPIVSDHSAYFDEETVALGWRLEWREVPNFANGVDPDPEAFLRSYKIQFVDISSGQRIAEYSSHPCDLLTDDARLRSRYQLSVPTRELFPESTGSGQLLRSVAVTVTPVDQCGNAGNSFSFTLDEEPQLKPLPADDAQLLLSHDAEKGFVANLHWRQLSLPTRPGVARTDHWLLVLRPLRDVPMGAYPDEAADPTDRGLMSITGQALLDGDVVIRLTGMKGSEAADDAERDPADFVFDLPLDGEGEIPGEVFDHRLQPAASDSLTLQRAQSFFSGRSAAEDGGHAWRLFLRAETSYGVSGDGLPAYTSHSGLSPLRLLLDLPPEPQAAENADAAPRHRPLAHFEWPRPPVEAFRQVALPSAEAGPLTAPGLVRDADDELQLIYRVAPGRSRVVSVAWSAIPGAQEPAARYEAFAEYHLFETNLDALVNADLDPRNDFRPQWRQIARLLPSDAALLRQSPDNMADTQNWRAWTPATSLSNGWLESQGVAPADMPERRPGWYSWAESQLCWPDPLDELEQRLRELSAASELSALEALVALDVRDPGAADPALDGVRLAAWRDLGEQSAGQRLHPYLCLLLGHVSAQRDLDGKRRYTLQSSGQGLQAERGEERSTPLKDPAQWLVANNEVADPYGWAALSKLGLAVCLGLRDAESGLLESQLQLREQLDVARQVIDATLLRVAERDGWPTIPLATLQAHLSWDLPIQKAWAMRAEQGQARLEDAMLDMLQLSLRPRSEICLPYSVLQLGKFDREGGGEEIDAVVTLPHTIDLIYLSGRRAPLRLEGEAEFKLSHLFSSHERVLVRHINPENPACADYQLRKLLGLTSDKEDADNNQQCKSPVTAANTPLPLLHNSELTQLSPFERFAVDLETWKARFRDSGNVPGEEAQQFRRLLAYLAGAFANTESGDGSVKELSARLLADEDLPRRYIKWSQRFFDSAPLDSDRLSGLSGASYAQIPGDITLAAPINGDPIHVAADAQGRLHHVQRIDEQWATTRSYALLPLGRYERLLAAVGGQRLSPSEPVLGEGSRRADIHLPRVRRIEPPQPLGQRILSDDSGRWFHEFSLAIHSEEALTNSNLHAARKLEFGEILRRYSREFRHPAWLKRMTESGLFSEDEKPRLPSGGDSVSATDPSVSAIKAGEHLGADDYLAHFPKARWGALRFLTPAEPFYYSQQVGYLATAALETSVHKVMPLRGPLPRRPQPWSDPLSAHDDSPPSPPTVLIVPAPDWAQLDEEKQAVFTNWRAHLVGDNPLQTHLLPRAWRLRIRVPRLLESLDPQALETHFNSEREEWSVARIPDPDLRIHLLSSRDGATETIATIQADVDSPDDSAPLYTRRQVAEGYKVSTLIPPKGDNWSKGVVLELTVANGKVPRLLTSSAVSARVAVPTRLVAPGEALLSADELPDNGPLSQLAALALRLSMLDGRDELVLLNPPRPLRWLARVSMRVGSAEGEQMMTATDLALGLRLVLDVERRRAAGLVNALLANAPDAAVARGLLRRIELATAVYASQPSRLEGLTQAGLDVLKEVGISLWRSRADGVDWEQILHAPTPSEEGNDAGEIDDAAARRTLPPAQHILVVGSARGDEPASGEWQLRFNNVIELLGRDPDRPVMAAELLALSEAATELANLTHLETDDPPPQVFVQRGNEARTPWSGENGGTAEEQSS